MSTTRRQFLTVSSAALAAGLAGCTGGSAGGDGTSMEQPQAQASFYLLYDFARQVGGSDFGVESVVPFGQHGHGWDGPTAGQQRDILTSDLFVYVGQGFQPWADDVVETIDADGADVSVVSAREGIDRLEFGENEAGGHDTNEGSSEHEETEHHDGHDESGDEHHSESGHDHGKKDPHFWLDPRRTATAVENVRDGMVAVDRDNETAYHERADEYVAELTRLHETFASALSTTEKDAVFVAGHNAFRYLGETYGFDIHALRGLSPDEGVSASARREAQQVIESHDIEYVLHPVLEPRSVAEQLVADTDATGVLDVTAISGVTDEWAEQERGYVELMETINLPSFRKALGAE